MYLRTYQLRYHVTKNFSDCLGAAYGSSRASGTMLERCGFFGVGEFGDDADGEPSQFLQAGTNVDEVARAP